MILVTDRLETCLTNLKLKLIASWLAGYAVKESSHLSILFLKTGFYSE